METFDKTDGPIGQAEAGGDAPLDRTTEYLWTRSVITYRCDNDVNVRSQNHNNELSFVIRDNFLLISIFGS